MKNLNVKVLSIIGIAVFLILVLVVYRSFAKNHFQNNLTQWAQPTLNNENIVTPSNLSSVKKPLFLVLDQAETDLKLTGESLNTNSEKLLNKEVLKKILNYKGSVVIVSGNSGTGAKAWMLLSQMGRSNLLLLSNENEQFRYEFTPER